MIRIYQTFAVICAVGGILLGCTSGHGTLNSVKDFEPPRTANDVVKDEVPPIGLKIAESQSITVALPEPATVELLNGVAHTGKLLTFGLTDLTVEAGGVAQKLSMTEVRKVVFSEDIWIENLDGNRQQTRIRGLTQNIEGIPITALVIKPSNQTGILNLTDVLSNKEYAKLTSNPDRTYVLKALLFNGSEQMEAEVASIKK